MVHQQGSVCQACGGFQGGKLRGSPTSGHHIQTESLCQEVGEVVVISQHSHQMCHTFSIITLVLQGHDNGKHFLILCSVVALGRHHSP